MSVFIIIIIVIWPVQVTVGKFLIAQHLGSTQLPASCNKDQQQSLMQATHASANQSDGLRTQGGHGGNGETLHKSGIFYYKKKRKKDDNKKTKPSPARHRMMRRSKILFHCKWPHCSGEFLKTFFFKTHTHTHTQFDQNGNPSICKHLPCNQS